MPPPGGPIHSRLGAADKVKPPMSEEKAERTPATNLFVSAAAARTYAKALGLQEEAARRQLTELLAGRELRPNSDPGRLPRIRVRSRTTQLEVHASVAAEDSLLVVVAVSIRDYLSA